MCCERVRVASERAPWQCVFSVLVFCVAYLGSVKVVCFYVCVSKNKATFCMCVLTVLLRVSPQDTFAKVRMRPLDFFSSKSLNGLRVPRFECRELRVNEFGEPVSRQRRRCCTCLSGGACFGCDAPAW